MPIANYERDLDLWCYKNRRVKTRAVRCLLPRRCYLSGKTLFLNLAMKITCRVTGPGTPAIIHYWVDTREFLLDEIKGD